MVVVVVVVVVVVMLVVLLQYRLPCRCPLQVDPAHSADCSCSGDREGAGGRPTSR